MKGARATILVVEDSPDEAFYLRMRLEAEKYDVLTAGNGADALQLVQANLVDLVLLDVGLPDMDGFEVSHRLAGLPSPPVVVLISSRPIADLRRQVADSPVAGFIAKHELSAAAVAALAG